MRSSLGVQRPPLCPGELLAVSGTPTKGYLERWARDGSNRNRSPVPRRNSAEGTCVPQEHCPERRDGFRVLVRRGFSRLSAIRRFEHHSCGVVPARARGRTRALPLILNSVSSRSHPPATARSSAPRAFAGERHGGGEGRPNRWQHAGSPPRFRRGRACARLSPSLSFYADHIELFQDAWALKVHPHKRVVCTPL